MNLPKQLIAAGAVAAISATGIGGVAAVSAQTDTASSDPTSSLVTKIAQKFNLKTEDVASVFNEDRQAKETERTAQAEKELTQAVADGKLTAAQKDAILAKRKELQAQRDSDRQAMDSKTDSERKAAMEAKKTELDNWVKQNNIPTDYVRYLMGGGKGHGHGERDMKPDSTTSSSTNSN